MAYEVVRPQLFVECPTCTVADGEIAEQYEEAERDTSMVTEKIYITCEQLLGGAVAMSGKRTGFAIGSGREVLRATPTGYPLCPHFTPQNLSVSEHESDVVIFE